ncbi:amidase [Amycolatopsis mongoliensis]|uniref:Amidase n=1 Tax=Amycolatopsis mongoliensis TaxID=715475 RepID=A0A9Y2JHS6_9PSEU|nr:amidase [Amycolatopsis sp. 4-36]WIX98870.1 amidase [Amycolatopsis sp. 4-36]
MSGRLHELSAAAQRESLRAGDVSSRELTEHYLGRIEKFDGGLGAFTTVTPDLALEEAARADQRIARGEWSPLLGLPLAIKDLYPAAGARTTFGSAALATFTPPADTWTVGLLRQAGAALVGKTSTAEFGATCYTDTDVTGRPTVTPYDLTRYASGSSGGAAAAVAAGLVPLAHAGDGAGSTRTPAATCHLVGVKPSRGLVSSSVPLSSLTATTIEGPIARSVADAALLLDVMAQPWSGDPDGWRADGSFADAVERPPARPLRVAVWTDSGLGGLPQHPEVVRAVERTATLLQDLGHQVREVQIPARCDEPVRLALRTLFASSVHAAVQSLVPPGRSEVLQPYTRYLCTEGKALSGSDLFAAQRVLARYASAFLTALESFDVALTPVTNGPPVPVGHFQAGGVAAIADAMLAWSAPTPWANLTGQPAVSLPSHLGRDGLPYGVQLVGRRRADASLLAVAAQLERSAPWNDVHPSCWDD